jgi:hypothetical protein
MKEGKGREEERTDGRKEDEEVKEGSLRLTAGSTLKTSQIENDLLLVFQKRRLRLDTNSKCQYDNEVHRQKNSHIDDDLILVLNKTDTYSQGWLFTVNLKVKEEREET